MPAIKKTKLVPYSQEQMYELVNDVKKYREFVPFCSDSQILSQTDEEIKASLTLARGGLSKSFTTLNRLQPHKMIEIRLVDGPFRQLEGFWLFEALSPSETRVVLDLDFEFSSRLIAMLFGPLFEQIASMLVDAFCQRAAVVYGSRNLS